MSRLSDFLAWKRRAGTALRQGLYGRQEVARSLHEPLPDIEYPHLCSVEWQEVGDPRYHPQRRKPRKPGTDLAAKAGWR